VFLREIAKRLIAGLEAEIPDLQTRVDHILTKQIFGIGITRLTSLLARRSLYCSKHAKGDHSVAKSFASDDGNIWFERVEHIAQGDRCVVCGAGKEFLEREWPQQNHAYAFIHSDDIKARLAALFGGKVNFDVIIGNPPYQIEADDAGKNLLPIYNLFVDQAKRLNPRLLSMITPSRWMAGGKGLEDFCVSMLNDSRVREIVDYPNAAEAFPGVDVKGGVSYFLWERDYDGSCLVTTVRGESSSLPVERKLNEFDVFVREGRALEILKKVVQCNENSLFDVVSTRDPFGPALSSNFTGYRSVRQPGDLRLYMNQASKRGDIWVEPTIASRNKHLISVWKVVIPKVGPGNSGGHVIPDMVLLRPFVGEPGSVCTASHLVIGPLQNEQEAANLAEYLKTRFVRFLVSLRKSTQSAARGVYTWVPQQPWDRAWTDADLYEKYGITDEEIAFIESMIRPMGAGDD
jgi:site-specific DNA-methyltransferase (adenine-specific)